MVGELDEAGQAAEQDFDESEVGQTTVECGTKTEPPAEVGTHWIELEMVGEDDEPMPGVRYRLELSDGRVLHGRLGSTGVLRVEGLTAQPCRVNFPDLDDEAWAAIA